MTNFKVGNTPLQCLEKAKSCFGVEANLFAKLESFNAAGSVKDRVALQMVEDAEKSKTITPGDTIIEPTSGNTGIGLAAVAKERGYKCIIVMPDNMSKQRRELITSYGAEIVLTNADLGMQGSIDKANEIQKAQGGWIAGQFENPSNWKAHYNTTGPEIFKQMDGKIDAFVCGIGTGGTITGVGKYLKEKNSNTKIIGVEPSNSAVLNGGTAGPHKIQGIGAGFIPKVLNMSVVDEVISVSDDDAIKFYNYINKEEKISAGISSGAALSGAIDFAKRNAINSSIVILFPDGSDRYE